MSITAWAVFPEGTEGVEANKLYEVTGRDCWEVFKRVGLDYLEIVKGEHGHHFGFVLTVDDDGHSKKLSRNPVAGNMLGYPDPLSICGPALFFSLERDPMEGDDLVSLSEGAKVALRRMMNLPVDAQPDSIPEGDLVAAVERLNSGPRPGITAYRIN